MDLNRIIIEQTLKDTYIHPTGNGEDFETKDSKKIKDLVTKMLDNENTLSFDEEVRDIGKTTLILKLAELTGMPIVVENSSCIAHRAKEENKTVHLFNTREIDVLVDFFKKNKVLRKRVLVDEISNDSLEKLEVAGITAIGFLRYEKNYLSRYKILCKIRSIACNMNILDNIPSNLLRNLNTMQDAVICAYKNYEDAKHELMITSNERTKEHENLLKKLYENRKKEFDEAVELFYKEKEKFDIALNKINKALEGEE